MPQSQLRLATPLIIDHSVNMAPFWTDLAARGHRVLFQGRVHTNQGFGFSSSSPVTFTGDVTQVNSTYTYNGSSYNVSSVQPNSTPRTGMTFNSSYTTVAALPLPINSSSQKLAVLNSTGLADNTYPSTTSDPKEPPDPTVTQMKAVLKTAANATVPTTGSGAAK